MKLSASLIVVGREADDDETVSIDTTVNRPTPGSFDLLTFGSLINAGYIFDFSSTQLAPGLAWDTSRFGVDDTPGDCALVPDPPSARLIRAKRAGLWILTARIRFKWQAFISRSADSCGELILRTSRLRLAGLGRFVVD